MDRFTSQGRRPSSETGDPLLPPWVRAAMTPAMALPARPIAEGAVDIVSMGELRELAQVRDTPCVSIYLPLEAAGADVGQNPAVLKNLLREAETRLEDWPLDVSAIAELLQPAADLLQEPSLWKQRNGGLAAFLSPSTSATIRLAHSPAERLRIGERFDLAPLLPLAAESGTFYILAVSLNAVRVIEGASGGFRRLDVPDLPTDFESALGYEQYDAGVQYHSASPGGQGKQPPIVHGHGDSDEDRLKKDILNYFHRIADRLLPTIDRDAPIILAAVGSHFPLWRQAFDGEHLLESGIEGNPELLSDLELWQRALREAVAPWLRESRKRKLESLRELPDRARIAHGYEDLTLAAMHGRIDTLLLEPEAERWGSIDLEHGHVHPHATPEPGDRDLATLILSDTLAHGGTPVPVTAEEAGDLRLPAALLRY